MSGKHDGTWKPDPSLGEHGSMCCRMHLCFSKGIPSAEPILQKISKSLVSSVSSDAMVLGLTKKQNYLLSIFGSPKPRTQKTSSTH